MRAIVAYVALLLMIRVTTRRAAGPATPFQLILIFLFGGMTVQAIVSDDRSITNALLGVATVAWVHLVFAWAKLRWPAFGRVVDGIPVVLVEQGQWHRDRMRKLQLTDADVIASSRQKGIMRREQVQHAVYERNGEISVFTDSKDGDGTG